jgi:hypothetical protein
MNSMTLRASRSTHRLAFWALAGLALLVSHDAVWLVQLGPGEGLAAALRSGGHGYWGGASGVMAVLGTVAALATVRRLSRLQRAAGKPGAGAEVRVRASSYLVRSMGAWPRLLLLVLVGFTLQENLEHALTHGHTPGLSALIGPEHPLAVPVIAVITLIASLLASIVLVAEEVLLAIIRRLGSTRRAPRRLLRPVLDSRRPSTSRPRAHAGRAPPGLLVHG